MEWIECEVMGRKMLKSNCIKCNTEIFDRPKRIKEGIRKTDMCKPCCSSRRMKNSAESNRIKVDNYHKIVKVLTYYSLGNEDGGNKARQYFKEEDTNYV